jgi:hypothetical protein
VNQLPELYSPGSVEEIIIHLRTGYASWREHEGMLELLRSAQLIARLDSKDEIEDMMEGETFKTRPGSDRSKAERLEDVSLNRLWGYFDDAVEDSFYLEPANTRPSVIHREHARAVARAAMEEEEE